MRIAIDIDKTLLDCNSFLYKLANQLISKNNNNPKNLKYKSIENIEVYKENLLNKISKIHNHNYYSINENASTIINKWFDEGHEIILLSSRPSSKSLAVVLLYCMEKFNIHYTQIITACNNKPAYCKENDIDIIIDNSFNICKVCSENGIKSIHYLPDEKIEKAKVNSNFIFAKSWNEIEIIVDIILKSSIRTK